ncbi:uncharacterized protein DNG_03714 [Cephalotrichum gorgonifer]|uniref:Yeast cell wall synthesis Kre9/Knh1-like N-terminal domain-containing protein n=1 Tax=Cephalotrichum gorgonifer TaxID=2041049 RepID=A0AAE8MX50_9PEZI|nr:uncharacterized protein DNG_03714 [Cephalotrichum gorgonifer]
MQFVIPAATLLAFVSGALAQVAGFDTITKPETDEKIAAGSTYTIVWEAAPAKYDDETVTISLIAGKDRGSLIPLADPIAVGVVNSEGSYAWKVASDLGDAAVYGIKIALDSDPTIFQYSFPFHVEASDDVPTNSTGPATSTAGDDDSASSTVVPPKPTGHSNHTTSAAPKPTVTTTSTTDGDADSTPEPTADTPEESNPPTVGDNGAATNGAMGTFALVGALAIAAFNF